MLALAVLSAGFILIRFFLTARPPPAAEGAVHSEDDADLEVDDLIGALLAESRAAETALSGKTSTSRISTAIYETAITVEELERELKPFYKGISGYKPLPDAEVLSLESEGRENNPLYGEILPSAVWPMQEAVGGITGEDVFCDLGSGTGKLVMSVCIATKASSCVGVEFSNQRHEQALTAHARAQISEVVGPLLGDRLRLAKENFLDADLSACTVFYVCTSALSRPLRDMLSARLLAVRPAGFRLVLAGVHMFEDLSESPRTRFLRKIIAYTTYGETFLWAFDVAPAGVA